MTKKFPCGHTYDDHYHMADNPKNHGKKSCNGTKKELQKCKSCNEWDSILNKCLFNGLYPNMKCKQFWSKKDAEKKNHEEAMLAEFKYKMSCPPLYSSYRY